MGKKSKLTAFFEPFVIYWPRDESREIDILINYTGAAIYSKII